MFRSEVLFSLTKRFFVFPLVLILLLGSCSKDSVEPEKSGDFELAGLTITKSANPDFTEDAYVYRHRQEYYVTVPEGADLSNVEITFKVDKNAQITVNDRLINGHTGRFDLRETLIVDVTAENGAAKRFDVLAQTGLRQLDRLIYEFKTKYNIPGVSYAISSTEQSTILYSKAVGYSIREEKFRTLPSHLFRLASMSKQMTAISVMKLLDEGKLSLDDTVFGEQGILGKIYGIPTPMAASVTVRHLLDHTSGWVSNPDPMFTSSFRGMSLDQLISYVLTSPQNLPGRTYSYFNMGYGILGKIIEKITGKNYEDYMKEVLSEAGITDIHVGGNKSQRRSNEVVYYSQGGSDGYQNDMQVIAAAGGVIASTEQLLHLLPYIDGRDNIPDILSKDTRQLMFTQSSVSGSTFYALGWRGGHRLFPESFFHGGNLAGTAVMWVVGPKYNVIMLANSRSYESGFDDAIYYLLENLINQANVTNWD